MQKKQNILKSSYHLMKTYISNNNGVVIAILLFLILIVLISGFDLWNKVLSILGIVAFIIILLFMAKFLQFIFQLSSFAFTHTIEGGSRIKTRWSIALSSFYKQQRKFFIVSLISLLLLLLALIKYIITSKWGS